MQKESLEVTILTMTGLPVGPFTIASSLQVRNLKKLFLKEYQALSPGFEDVTDEGVCFMLAGTQLISHQTVQEAGIDGEKNVYAFVNKDIAQPTEQQIELGHRLWDAAKAGDLDGVRRAHEEGATPDFTDERKYQLQTALHKAAEMGNEDMVLYLLDNGWTHDRCSMFGDLPLHKACTNGRTDVARLIITKFGENQLTWINYHKRTPLHLAALSRAANPDTVEYLARLVSQSEDTRVKAIAMQKDDKAGKTPVELADGNKTFPEVAVRCRRWLG